MANARIDQITRETIAQPSTTNARIDIVGRETFIPLSANGLINMVVREAFVPFASTQPVVFISIS